MKHLRYLLMAALVAMPLMACDEDSDPVVEVTIYGTVTGTVSAEGTGLSGVGVTLVGSTSLSSTTGAGGTYTFTNVEAGGYGVSIDASTHSDVSFSQTSRTTTIATSGETVTVDFGGSYIRTATITGVVSASGAPLGGIAVTVTGGGDNATNNSVTNAGGEYFATGLRAGAYTVSFTAPADVTFATTSAAVTVATGETKTAHFPGAAVQLATISGAVTVDNVGTAGITVTLGGAAVAATETGPGGAYTFTNLTPGAYTVTVTAPANVTFGTSVKPITVGEGDNGVVNFAGEGPPEAATISGSVTVDNVGMAGVAVALTGPEAAATVTGAGGVFSFANLTAGVYTVTITAPAETTFADGLAKGVTVAAGENGVVDFAGVGPVEPATISIQSITTGAGVPVVLTAVMGQIEVSLNIIRGDRDLAKVDVVFTNEGGTPIIAATQTFAAPAPPAEAAAGDDELITLSIPTTQVRLGTTLPLTYIPVIFNGKANISANLWEVGAAAPIPTNDVPVVMTNLDAMMTSDGALIPGLVTRLNPSVTPDINTGVGLDWNTGGIQYDNPIYISYSTTLQVPTWTDQAGPCGAGVGATAGTAAAGITLHNTWACTLVEGTNAGPALTVPTWVGPALGPDGTGVTTPAAWSSLGAKFSLGEDRWYVNSPTPLALTAPAVWDVDNLGPMVFINGSASAVTPLAFGVNGTVAFNDTWDERWINAAFDFVADAPITLTDGGVGPDNATRSALLYDQTTPACGAQVVNNITDFPVTVTDNGSDGHVICAEGVDLLANTPQNIPVSFYFGKDIADPDIRIHGTALSQPLAVNIPASVFSLNGVDPALPNTSIYNMAAPFNALFTWGVEALDDRAGFHQNVTTVATVEAGPVVQTVSRADGWSGVPEPDVATGADYLMLILGDNYARSTTSAGVASEWAFLGGLAQPGIFDYNVAVTDMAGNVSTLGPFNWLTDQVAGPTLAALTLGQVTYTPGETTALFSYYGGDDLEATFVQASMTYPADIGQDGIPNPMELVYGALATDPAAANQRWDTDFTFQNLNPFSANVSALPTGVNYGLIGRIDFTTATGALPDGGAVVGTIQDDDFNTLEGADPDVLMEDDDFLPTAVTGWVQEDAGMNPASATVTTPFVAMDFGGWSAATSQPYTGADIIDFTLFGADLDAVPTNDVTLVAQHKAANSTTPVFFDAVLLVHRAPVTGVVTVCAVDATPGTQDQGGFRYYRYEFTNPIPATDVDVCTGPASLDAFHAVGVKDTGTGRALLMTDPAVSIIFP